MKTQRQRIRQQVLVPSWALPVLRMAATVLLSGLTVGLPLYVRFVSTEKTTTDLAATTKETSNSAVALEKRVTGVEIKMSVMEKEISAALIRIESTMRDVQIDVKDLQKHQK